MDNSNQNNNSEWRERELGALWVRQGKGSGQKYLSGHLEVETMPGVSEKVKVVVFSNKGKAKNEQAPDYVVYRSVDREDNSASDSASSSTSATTQNESAQTDTPATNNSEEDEVPAAF